MIFIEELEEAFCFVLCLSSLEMRSMIDVGILSSVSEVLWCILVVVSSMYINIFMLV